MNITKVILSQTNNYVPLFTLTCLLTMPATAQVNYAISGNTAYVTDSHGASGNIVIASTNNGYPVTGIGAWAFSDCYSLTSVTIPNSVTSIGDAAFLSCRSLASVAIGNGVTSIGDAAFSACDSLTSVTIPDNVHNIASGAFSDCGSLTSVTIPNSVTNIGYGTFYMCFAMTNFSVDAANSVYSSLDGVLFNKAQTTLIQFPGGRGGSYAIPDSVTGIGDSAFSFSSLASVTIPNSVTSIGGSAFSDCYSLTTLTIGNGVTSIGYEAFYDCTSLTSMAIPNSVTSIGYEAFYNCTSLTNFSVDAANSVYSSLDGVLFNKSQTALIQFPGGRGGSYTIPTSVTGIGDEAFSYCDSLTNLTFLGNAPSEGVGMFGNIKAGAKVYYYYGTTGWGPTYGGLPTVMLGAPAPQVGAGSAGVKADGFGFTLNGVVNQTIVVEASTNLANWQPIWTNTLSSLSTNFVDSQWLNFPHRFYRLRSP